MGKYLIRGSVKPIKKRYNRSGDCYFIFNKRRYRLDAFQVCCNELIKSGYTHFFIETNNSGVLISDCEDCVYAYHFNIAQN